MALIPIIISVYYVVKSISSTLIASKIDKLKPSNNYTYIVQSYGKILEESCTIPRIVIDEKKLPHTKQQIKEALIFAFQNEKNTKMREHLKNAYVSLATWQANVGKEDVIDIDTKILNQNTQSLAQQLVDKTEDITNWIKIVTEEEKLLIQELEKLGILK